MLRFILRRKTRDNESGLEGEGFYTIDADVPELERALGSGGIGHQGYDVTELIGVEQLEDAQETTMDADNLDNLDAVIWAMTPGPWEPCPMDMYVLGGDGHFVAEVRGFSAEVSGQRPEGTQRANALEALDAKLAEVL